MTFLGMRKYPTPVQKPMMPFVIGGVVMFFAINSLAGSLMETDEWKHDPRNPKGELAIPKISLGRSIACKTEMDTDAIMTASVKSSEHH